MAQRKKSGILSFLVFPTIIVASIVVCIIFWKPISELFESPETVRAWVWSWGLAAPLAFIVLQIIQVVIFMIPGEVVQLAGGYLFGVWLGFALSLAGIMVGSVINFYLGRWFGASFVRKLFGEENLAKFTTFTSTAGVRTAFFLLFVIPGIPKDILCYVAGLSSMRLVSFMLISGVGRLPGIFGSSFMGDAAAEHNWGMLIWIAAIATVLFAIGAVFQGKIFRFIESISKKKPLLDERPDAE
jgi:uncharacterized membrane protein YdjX (TVP38/TMEM64 family)